jgi:hypothetical protein
MYGDSMHCYPRDEDDGLPGAVPTIPLYRAGFCLAGNRPRIAPSRRRMAFYGLMHKQARSRHAFYRIEFEGWAILRGKQIMAAAPTLAV